jgi:SUMO ligase MMS21 Smc5/6 complex component
MENISETVLMCMIAIAAIQLTIIFTILKSRKKDVEEIVSNKKTLIEILNSSDASGKSMEECCG